MVWIEPVSTAVTAAGLASQLIHNQTELRIAAIRLYRTIVGQKLVIASLGAGGVGKSTFGKILTGTNPLDFSAIYDESIDTETYKLKGSWPGKVIVPPGQDTGEFGRVERTWPEIYRAVMNSDCKLMVNVCAYGFHSMGIHSYTDHDLYAQGMAQEEFLSLYLEECRQKELGLARKFVDGIKAAKGPLTVITIVNKQDLWWDMRQEVRDFYENGEYSKIIQGIGEKIGKENFRHELLPTSLTIGNLNTAKEGAIARTASGYDLPTHIAYLESLLTNINRLI